jgi:Winged helix-turn helix
MRRTEAPQGVGMVMFLNILHRWESAELNHGEPAELLGVSERRFRRWRGRYEEEGKARLLDQRLGRGRAIGFRPTAPRKWSRSTASAIRASPPRLP